MSFINTENFEPYADVIAPNCPENFSYIHDLLAEPVAKLEKKGYVVAQVNFPAPFPTLHEEKLYGCNIPEEIPSVPDHSRPVTATFRYTSDGDYGYTSASKTISSFPAMNRISGTWYIWKESCSPSSLAG